MPRRHSMHRRDEGKVDLQEESDDISYYIACHHKQSQALISERCVMSDDECTMPQACWASLMLALLEQDSHSSVCARRVKFRVTGCTIISSRANVVA